MKIMKTQRLLLFLAAVLSLPVCSGRSQTALISQEGTVVSRALSGHVDVGITRLPAKNVTVELCSSDWQTVLASTKTDDNGHFSLGKPAGKLFYIRVSSPGINPFQLRVRIKKGAPQDLAIHLSIAT
jgi:hypothetical protein